MRSAAKLVPGDDMRDVSLRRYLEGPRGPLVDNPPSPFPLEALQHPSYVTRAIPATDAGSHARSVLLSVPRLESRM